MKTDVSYSQIQQCSESPICDIDLTLVEILLHGPISIFVTSEVSTLAAYTITEVIFLKVHTVHYLANVEVVHSG